MSGWPRQFWSGGFSPFSSREQVPAVTDQDFSYITSQDLEQPEPTYNPTTYHRTPPSLQEADDVILLKYGRSTYPLKFPAFTISDRQLLVGDVRRRAAETLGVADERYLTLYYKGRLLKEDSLPVYDYDMKNFSEALCVVEETKTQASEDETTGVSKASKKKKSKSKKKSDKKSDKKHSTGGSSVSSNSVNDSTTNVSVASSTPTPVPVSSADANTPLGKLAVISTKFHTDVLPLCNQYIASPPTDLKKKDFEHKRLGEVVMREVLLKLDAVETEGNPNARQKRKDLVKEAQDILSLLDAAAAPA